MSKAREPTLQAIVCSNFTIVAGYLVLSVPPGWKQIGASIGLVAAALVTTWCWYAAIRRRNAKPADQNPDAPAESH
jgi:hypothetical protein